MIRSIACANIVGSLLSTTIPHSCSLKYQLEASANERIELAEIADSIEQFCKQVRPGLTNATFEHKRALVELLIDQVVVTDEEVEIRYAVPTSPEEPHHPFCHLRTDYLDSLPGRYSRGNIRHEQPLLSR